jgi:hypothetical protein
MDAAQETARAETSTQGANVYATIAQPDTFRKHAEDQVSWRLLEKAKKEFDVGNYYEVVKIGACQYPYNVGAVGVYYDLIRGDTYDRVGRLVSNALAEGVPIKVRAEAVLAELEILTRYYKNMLAGRVYDPAAIKK